MFAVLSLALDRGEGGKALGYDLAAFASAADGTLSELARYALARRERRDGPFAFSEAAFSDALGLLDGALSGAASGDVPRPQVVAVDEIGALELERGGGWSALLDRPPAVPILVLTARSTSAVALEARLGGPSGAKLDVPPGAPASPSIVPFRVGPKSGGAEGGGPELAKTILRALPDLVDRAVPLG